MFDNFTRGFHQAPVLREIQHQLTVLNNKVEKLMIDVSKIQLAVDRSKAGQDSVIALLGTLVGQIKDLSKQLADAIAAADPVAQEKVQAQLDTLAADLDSETGKLAAASTQSPT